MRFVHVKLRLAPRAPYYVLAGFTALLAIGFGVLDYVAPAGRPLAKVAGYDPVNYFAISHSLLFDHDFNLNNEFTKIKPDGDLWSAVRPETGLPGSPWGIGYSILEIPFLATGTALDAITGNSADGFSRFATYVYCLGNVIMMGLGLMALFTLLNRMAALWGVQGERSAGYSLFVTFAIFCGTNVGYYTFSQLAHSSAFWLASTFLAYWWSIRFTHQTRSWFLLGFIGGFLSITRWQDLIYLGGPLLFDLMGRELWKSPLPWLRSRICYGVALGLCWIPQIAEWKIIYGKYLTIPQGEGFLSFPPAFMREVLLSSRNGWFSWTPLVLLGIAGLFYGAMKYTREFVPWIVVILLEVAAVGSMQTWHGFDSFGARYLLSTTPLVAMGLMSLLCAASTVVRRSLVVATVCCCIFAILFAIQFRLDLIPKNETLTATEIFTDKLHLLKVRQRKMMAAQARKLLEEGDPKAAIETLERAVSLGEDRDVLYALREAYKVGGKAAEAESAKTRLKALLASTL